MQGAPSTATQPRQRLHLMQHPHNKLHLAHLLQGRYAQDQRTPMQRQ